jgi:hypothetical protein
MSAIILPAPKMQFLDAVGNPLVAGKVFTYIVGTNTPKDTYTDETGMSANTNPVILDARGEAAIFWDGNYRVTLKDAADNTIYTVDGLNSRAERLATPRNINNIPFDGSASIGLGTFLYEQQCTTVGFTSAALITLLTASANIADRNVFAAVPYDGFMRFSISQIVSNLTAGTPGSLEIYAVIAGVSKQPVHLCSPQVVGTPAYASMNLVFPVTAGQSIDIRGRVVGGVGATYTIGLAGVGFEMVSST